MTTEQEQQQYIEIKKVDSISTLAEKDSILITLGYNSPFYYV